MKKMIFISALTLGFAWNCPAQTWTYVQDSITTGCIVGSSSCTLAVNNGNSITTTAGSVLVAIVSTGNNVTISSVSGGGGVWTACANCHVFMASPARNIDAWYNVSGSGGATSITVTLSGSSSGLFKIDLIEILPPAGSTAAFDAGGGVSSASCVTCTGVGLTLTATDAVVQFQGIHDPNGWNAWSSPWTTDTQGNAIYLNASGGTLAAPTVVMANNQAGAVINALAFKSTAGPFTPPARPISVVSYTNPQGINCAPNCSLTIPSTGSGHLLYIEAANLTSTRIASVSGGGTWVAPNGSNTCAIVLSGGFSLTCAYALSSTPGATSLNVTMSGNSNNYFAIYEVASTSGSFAFDAQGSVTVPFTNTPQGPTLTLSGTNDVIFQSAFIPGGTSSVSRYPIPYNVGNDAQFFNAQAANAALLNTADGTGPFWVNGQPGTTTIHTGVAFKSGTSGTIPAPPTGLTTVVN